MICTVHLIRRGAAKVNFSYTFVQNMFDNKRYQLTLPVNEGYLEPAGLYQGQPGKTEK